MQNDIISACNSVVQRSIITEVNKARCFSLLADETTDVSRKEQLTVCLRYVRPDFTIRERFLCFAEAPNLTGMGLSVQLLSILRESNVTSIPTIWLVKGMMARRPCPVISMVYRSTFANSVHQPFTSTVLRTLSISVCRKLVRCPTLGKP